VLARSGSHANEYTRTNDIDDIVQPILAVPILYIPVLDVLVLDIPVFDILIFLFLF
jgi:hypothetical protein